MVIKTIMQIAKCNKKVVLIGIVLLIAVPLQLFSQDSTYTPTPGSMVGLKDSSGGNVDSLLDPNSAPLLFG